jgi:hypothetical protein
MKVGVGGVLFISGPQPTVVATQGKRSAAHPLGFELEMLLALQCPDGTTAGTRLIVPDALRNDLKIPAATVRSGACAWNVRW